MAITNDFNVNDQSFNCTIMELKLKASFQSFRVSFCFNCTIMELKSRKGIENVVKVVEF